MSQRDEKNRTVEAQFKAFTDYLRADLPEGEEKEAAILSLAESQAYAHMSANTLPGDEEVSP